MITPLWRRQHCETSCSGPATAAACLLWPANPGGRCEAPAHRPRRPGRRSGTGVDGAPSRPAAAVTALMVAPTHRLSTSRKDFGLVDADEPHRPQDAAGGGRLAALQLDSTLHMRQGAPEE